MFSIFSVWGVVQPIRLRNFLTPLWRRANPYPGYIERLDQTWQNLIRNSVARNTTKQYSCGQRKFINFCQNLGVSPCPASEVLLMRFVASISNSVRGSTIQNYPSTIRFLHISNGFSNPICEYERLKLIVRALKKRSGKVRQRAPVTVAMLRGIFSNLNFNNYNDLLFWTMICCAFLASLGYQS